MKTLYRIINLSVLLAALSCLSCVKTIPESKTVPLSDIYLDAENSRPWFKIADGDYTVLADVKGLAASITVRFEILGDAKKNSVAEYETGVRTETKLAASAELSKDFSNKAYYLIPLDAYGNVINISGAEGTDGYFKGVASDVYNFISYAETGAVRPFAFRITVKDRKSLAAVMDLRGFRIMEEGAVSYPVAGGGSGGSAPQKVYKIGTDLAAGEYFLETTGTDLTYRIDGDAAFEGTLRNNTFLILKKGETLTITGGGKITPAAEVSRKPKSLDSIPPGYYRVGKDIPAGKYTATGNMRNLSTCNDPRGDIIEGYQKGFKGNGDGEVRMQNGQTIAYSESYESVYAMYMEGGKSYYKKYTGPYEEGIYENGKKDYPEHKAKYEADLARNKNPAARYLEAKEGQYLLVARDSSPAKLIR